MGIEVDNLFQALDIIMDKRLSTIHYDTTEICEIVDASNAKNGKYYVTPNGGETKYAAYSEEEYTVGETVRVSIPNGDYSQKKFIEGKYVVDDAIRPITYSSPLNTVIDITGNMLSESKSQTTYGLVANGLNTQIPIWSADLSNDESYQDLQSTGIYNTIALQANFKSLLGNKDMRSGSYGLRLDVYVKLDPKSTKYILRSVYLDSSEMFGDVYNFMLYSRQSKKFDLSSLGMVEKLVLYFYQNSDFTYYEPKIRKTTALPYEPDTATSNLFVTDVVVSFGSDLQIIEDNTLSVYTTNDSTYRSTIDPATNEKKIGFLWYNKNENNQYVGFSDGIYDPDYDEEFYLNESEYDYRLASYLGQENVPHDVGSLQLAADISDAKTILKSTYDLLTKDLISTLRQYSVRVSNVSEITDAINLLINKSAAGANATNNLLCIYELANDKRTELYDFYTKFLTYNYKVQESGGVNYFDKTEDDLYIETWKTTPSGESQASHYRKDFYNEVKGFFLGTETASVRSLITNFLEHSLEVVKTSAQGCRGAHDTYNIRLNKIIDKIEKNFEELDELLADNKDLMLQYPLARYIEYQPKDLTGYDNHYCVYWYRYEPNYTNEEDRFKKAEWRRLTTRADFGLDGNPDEEVKNFGLPVDDEPISRDGRQYYSNKAINTNAMATRLMSMYMEEEKYLVILFHNHAMYESELEPSFKNLDPVVSPHTADKTAALTIEHSTNSLESYQLYGIDNYLTNAADASVSRELKINYQGELGGVERLANAKIYWYVPQNATMIQVDEKYLTTTMGFVADSSGNTDQEIAKSGFVSYYKTIRAEQEDILDDDGNKIGERTVANPADLTFCYKIKNYYVQTASRNMILCKVLVDEEKYSYDAEIFMNFNSYGTSGTDYTLAVYPPGTQTAITNSSSLVLNVDMYDYNNERMKLYSGATTPRDDAEDFECSWVGPTSYVSTVGVLYDESDDSGQSVVGVEVRMPNEIPTNFYGILESKVAYDIAEYKQKDDEDEGTVEPRIVALKTFTPIAYSRGDYYIEGATTVVYNSQGNEPVYYKSPYKIFECNTNKDMSTILGKNGDPKYKIKWVVKHYKDDGEGKPVELDSKIHEDYKICKSFMPNMNSDNRLSPSNMFIGDTDCYCAVECWIADMESDFNKKVNFEDALKYDLYWVQPILIIQNRYASPMLNAWDGSFQINEENGTIMSTMLGAGRKTEHNTFEGVLMGDIGVGADMDVDVGPVKALTKNKSGIGIYGFHNGAQSFGFNVDGTAFIGKSGAGRISFDGNNGVIYSGNWLNSFINKDTHDFERQPFNTVEGKVGINAGRAGLAIDLQNGHLDAYNFKVTSSNIYLNSNPIIPETDEDPPTYFFRIGNDGTALDWSQQDLRPTKGYMALDSQGNLTVRVNSLYLTGQLGGANLLHQTSPKKNVPQVDEFLSDEDNPVNDSNTTVYKRYIRVKNNEAYNEQLSYYIKDPAAGKYVEFTYTTAQRYKEAVESTNGLYWDNGKIVYEWDITDATTTKWIYDRNLTTVDSSENRFPNPGAGSDDPNYFIRVTGGSYQISQRVVNIKPNEEYTLSGYIIRENSTAIDSKPKLAINIPNTLTPEHSANPGLGDAEPGIYICEFEASKWQYFEYTFKTQNVTEITVGLNSLAPYCLWHLKLEQGSIGTAWEPSAEDVEANVDGAQTQYDLALGQNEMFNKLAINPNNGQLMDGIWMVDGSQTISGRTELFISATYISTGILRSQNFDGTIEIEGVAESIPGQIGTPKLHNIYKVSGGEHGTYINLNDGYMWAKTFKLDAWAPGTDSGITDPGSGLYLNSDPVPNSSTDYWLRVGNNTNHIKLSADGNLHIQVSNNFKLQNSSGSLYFSDQPTSYTIPVSTITFTNSESTDADGNVTQSTTASTSTTNTAVNAVLGMGNNFAVTNTGTLYANGANISGSITTNSIAATGGTIGGWTISTDRISSGATTLWGYGKIETGHIVATKGDIGNWKLEDGKLTNGVVTLGDATSPIQSVGTGGTMSVNGLTGKLTGTSAELAHLTVTNSLTVNATGSSTDGDGEVDNETGVVAYSMRAAESQDPAGGGGKPDSAGTVTDALCTINGTTKITGNTEIGGTLLIDSTTNVSGKMTAEDVKFTGSIKCDTDDGEKSGVNGEFKIDGKGIFGGWYHFTFKKGILVSINNSTGSVEGDTIPDPGKTDAGSVLRCDSKGDPQWQKLGALADYDTITLSPSFKIGSSGSYTAITPTLNGDTATFSITVSGGTAGSSGTVYMLRNSQTGDYKLSTSGPSGDWEEVDSATVGGSGTVSDKTVYCKVVVSPKKNTT